jgi:hypothetical protein
VSKLDAAACVVQSLLCDKQGLHLHSQHLTNTKVQDCHYKVSVTAVKRMYTYMTVYWPSSRLHTNSENEFKFCVKICHQKSKVHTWQSMCGPISWLFFFCTELTFSSISRSCSVELHVTHFLFYYNPIFWILCFFVRTTYKLD